MAVFTHADARPAETDVSSPSYEGFSRGHAEGAIVIEYLDHSMAYAVPTWCSTSLSR
jgi:hypothetical protein